MTVAGEPPKPLLHVNRGAIRVYALSVIRKQLDRSNGQFVISLKAVNKKVCKHFNILSSGGTASIVKGVLVYQEHKDMTITWFDDRQTLLDIRKKRLQRRR